MQFHYLPNKLKVFALTWAINRCRSQLGLSPQRLTIEVSNRTLAPNECEINVKKILIGDNQIVTYEHYSEPGNPFLAYKYDDFYKFMRSWMGYAIALCVQYWITTNPEYRSGQEKAKASGDWMDHLRWSNQKSQEAYNFLYKKLDDALASFPIRLVKLLLFGRYRFAYVSAQQALIGEWITQDAAKLKYVFSENEFIRYDENQPKHFSYRIQAKRDRYLKIETTFLANPTCDTATLYFLDDYKSLEYRSGSYSVIWRAAGQVGLRYR